MVEILFNCKIKILQSDGDREFDNSPLLQHFRYHGIIFQKSCLHTQTQNGVAECKHRLIIEMAHTIIIHPDFSAEFWVGASYTATHTINRLHSSVLGSVSPFEKLFHCPHSYNFLKTFGCEFFRCSWILKYNQQTST